MLRQSRRWVTAAALILAVVVGIAALTAVGLWAVEADQAFLNSNVSRACFALVGLAFLVLNPRGYRPLGVSLLSVGFAGVPEFVSGLQMASTVSAPIVVAATYALLVGMISGFAVVLDRATQDHQSRVAGLNDRWPYATPFLVGLSSTATAIVALVYADQAVTDFSGSVQVALFSGIFVGVLGVVRADRVARRRPSRSARTGLSSP